MGDRKLVKYTNHAKLQLCALDSVMLISSSVLMSTRHTTMKKRNISEEQVMIVLNFPDEFRQGSHSNETIAIKRFNRKRVRVVYVSEPDEIRIITVTH